MLALVLGSASAAAQPNESEVPDGADEARLEEARRHFQEGLEFVEAERWGEAEERFRSVLAVRSSAVAAYNLASALSHQDRLVEARSLLEGVVRDESADAFTRAAAEQLLTEVRQRTGTVSIRLSGHTQDVRLTVDERQLETMPVQSVPVDPGEHTVSAHRGELTLEERIIIIGGGHPLTADVSMTLPAPVSSGTPAPDAALEPSDEGEGGISPWLWGAGAGVLVAATVVVILVASGGSGSAEPVQGDIDPFVFRGQVQP